MLKKGLFGLATLLLVALATLWFVDFEAEELGAFVLQQASASTGVHLEASRYRLNVLRGLELEELEARARVPGVSYAITMPTMRFEHRVPPLVRGRLEVERVVLVGPRVTIRTGLTPPPAPRRPRERREGQPRARSRTEPTVEPVESPVTLRVRELALIDAAFSLDDDLSLDGVDISLESPTLASGGLTLIHSVAARGRISVRDLTFRTLTVRNIQALVAMNDGRLELSDGVFDLERGSFGVDVRLDLNSIPARYRLSLTGALDGIPGDVRFEGEGFGLDPENLKGDGSWRVPAGRFDDAPLWASLGLTGSAYEATEVSLEVADGRVTLDGVWMRGSVGFRGELELVVSGRSVSGTWDEPVVN